MAALVVSAEEEERVRIPDLQRPEVEHALRKAWSAGGMIDQIRVYLEAEISSIYVVAEEKVSGRCGVAADFEEFHQVKLCLCVRNRKT
jgi:hypothetical protein